LHRYLSRYSSTTISIPIKKPGGLFSLIDDDDSRRSGFPWDQSKEIYSINTQLSSSSSLWSKIQETLKVMKVSKNLIIYLRYRNIFEGNSNNITDIIDPPINVNDATTIVGSKIITGFLKGIKDFKTFNDPSSDDYYNNLSIVRGTKTAFECATNAIFHHKDIRALQIIDNRNTNGTTTTMTTTTTMASNDSNSIPTSLDSDDKIDKHIIENGEIFVPKLSTIFEKNLADFYEDAISTIQKGQCKVKYELQDIKDVLVTNTSVIIGAKRGTPGVEKFVKTDGSYLEGNCSYATPMIPLSKETVDDILNYKFDNLKHHTIRCKVDIQCTEVFYVIDEVTGDIMQGSKEPKETIHELVLETCIDLSKRELNYEWSIIDIDNWLNGNEFINGKP